MWIRIVALYAISLAMLFGSYGLAQDRDRARHAVKVKEGLEKGRAKEVRVIPASSCSSLGLEDVGKALIPIDREASRGKEPATIKLIAWCVKGDDDQPPSNLHEEVIVAVSWRPGEAEILYLCNRWQQGRRDWECYGQLTAGLFEGYQFKAKTSGKHTEDDVIKFVRTTDFGNNDIGLGKTVLSIILYNDKFTRLHAELLAGVSLDTRLERYDEYWGNLLLQGSRWKDSSGSNTNASGATSNSAMPNGLPGKATAPKK